MTVMLGIFERLYGANAEMTLPRALLISAAGILVVFLVLGLIALFVKIMGVCFDAAARKKAAAPLTRIPEPPAPPPAAPQGAPLPEGTSQGTLTLVDVSEEEAAVVMAVTAHRLGVPLNRLQFHSIKLKKEGEDR